MQPLITPNWHIALVHFPIALVVVGTLVELFSFLGWRGSGFRRAGRWMLLLGAVAAVPTAYSGLVAWSEVLPPGGINELRQTQPELAKTMTWHIWSQASATLGVMTLVVTWIAMSPFWRDRLNVLFKLGLIGVTGLILLGAHLGGESVYDHGVGVDTRRSPTSLPSLEQARHLKTWEDLTPPLEWHMLAAGTAAAVACVTLGLAIRVAASGFDDPALTADHAGRIAAAFSAEAVDPAYPPAAYPAAAYPAAAYPPVTETVIVSRNYTAPIRATRFWLLAALLFVVAALLGDWMIAHDTGWDLNAMWDQISRPIDDGPRLTRLLAHFVVAGVLIVDTLVLALLSRFAPRQSVALLIFAVPLVLALTAQVWLGVLLLFDGPGGAVTHFGG